MESLSVLVRFEEGKDDNEDDAVKNLSEIEDFVRRLNVLLVGNNK
jgi:uncharacterized protein YgfB (UPF0149 family)